MTVPLASVRPAAARATGSSWKAAELPPLESAIGSTSGGLSVYENTTTRALRIVAIGYAVPSTHDCVRYPAVRFASIVRSVACNPLSRVSTSERWYDGTTIR
jgi:hypothetical protein